MPWRGPIGLPQAATGMVLGLYLSATSCGGGSDTTGPSSPPPPSTHQEWTFSNTPDPVSGDPILYASLLAEPAVVGGPPSTTSLSVRCKAHSFDVYVSGDVITSSGAVRYRLDNGVTHEETWDESTDFRSLFHPGDTRAFAQQLATATTLHFEYREYVGGLIEATFTVAGLGAHLPALLAGCPTPSTTGSLTVTSSTSGTSPDPDGYMITIDGSERGPLGSNAVVTVAGLPEGSHLVGLNGVAGNCTVQGANPSAVTVPASSTVQIAFAVLCRPIVSPASAILPISGDGQHGQVGSQLSQPLVVQVKDVPGNPVPGFTVNWSVVGGGSVSNATTVTGADGTTSVTRTLGTIAGPQTTLASSPGLAGSPVTFTHTATAGSASTVQKVDGDGQSALAGMELPKSLVVKVLDGQGNAVVGRAVTWVIGAGGGSVAPQNTTTDGQGQASTRWTLGPSVGNNTVNAVVSGVVTGTVTFTATATAGSVSAVRSTVAASPRSITAGASNSTITVRVRDGNGTSVRGVVVTLASSGSGNLFDPPSDTSDDNGVATFVFGSTVAELKTITATAGGVTLDQKPTITVVKAVSRTRITGQNLATPTQPGTPVHITFTVTSGEGGGTPTGQVTILSEQEPSATCTVDVSAGACDLTLNRSGNHHLIATYSGDSRFEDSSDDDNHQVINQPPVANGDSYSTQASTPLSVPAPGVLGNDTDANGDPLTANVVTAPTQGGLVLNQDGSFTYTPNPGASGSDSFTYTANDATLTSGPATVTITLTP
jgi:Big-like domain-containing protein